MNIQNMLSEIRDNIQTVIAKDSALGESLWAAFIKIHAADIADFLSDINRDDALALFGQLPRELKLEVFEELSNWMRGSMLESMTDATKVLVLRSLPSDELADLFDELSDEDLKNYLNLLHSDEREQVLSLMQFDPESAGGIMTPDVLSLIQDFTVEQAIKLLQRIQPKREVHQQIFVTDRAHVLVGHISLEDLVLRKPDERISSFMRENELVIPADQAQDQAAQEMVHYGLTTAPVVSEQNKFLGVISSEELVDVLVEEAADDVSRMASMPPTRYPYFEIPFFRLLYLRGYVLIALLVAEQFSGNFIRAFDTVMSFGILSSFIPMLTSAGGNSGSQTSAVLIQGLASGEINTSNMGRLFKREIFTSSAIACILGLLIFARSWHLGGSFEECMAIAVSLALIVLISSILGVMIPFILRHFGIDPAFSAGPFLATLMDVLGIAIFCYMSNYFIGKLLVAAPVA
jgi:magnesium transporter